MANPGNSWTGNHGASQTFPGTSSGWNRDRDAAQPTSTNNNARDEPHAQIKFQDVAQRLATLGIDAETLLTHPEAWKLATDKTPPLYPTEPTDYLMYINKNQKLTKQGEIVFHVQTVNLHKKTLPPTPNFRITVNTPRDHTAYVRILKDQLQPNRYVCSFRAIYRGKYTIRGLIGSENIMGSPVDVFVWSQDELTDPETSIIIQDPKSNPKENLIPEKHVRTSPVLHMIESGPRNLKPWGIAAHPFTEQIYVTDRDAHEVCSYLYRNQHFEFLFKFGQSGSRLGKLKRPTGIAVDVTNDRLIIADKDNHRICFFQLDGTYLMSFGDEGVMNGQFKYPWGVAVSPNGSIIAVADSRNHRIQLFNGNGVFLNKFAPAEENPNLVGYIFDLPRGIAFDNIGMNIYVTDFNLKRILGFSLDFRYRRSLTPHYHQIQRPQGITVNSAGNVVVCDTRSGSILIISPAGILLQTLTVGGHSGAQNSGQPLDVTACVSGRLFVLETCGRICVIEPALQRLF